MINGRITDIIATNKIRANTIRTNVRMDRFTNGLIINNLVKRATIEIEILTYSVISGGNPFFKNT